MNVRGHIDEVRFVDPLARKLDLGGSGRIPEGSSAYVRGWALALDPPRAADAALAALDDGAPFEIAYNQARPDVLKALDLPAMLPIGFHGVVSLAGLARGPHVLRVALADRTSSECAWIEPTVAFEIVDGALGFPATQRLSREELTVAVDAFSTSGAGNRDARAEPVSRGTYLTLRGWAVDRRFVTAAGDVYACLDGNTFVRGIIGTLRDDVAGSLGLQTVARCGYVIRIDTTGLAAGDHVVDVRAIAADGDRFATSEPFAFVVRDEP